MREVTLGPAFAPKAGKLRLSNPSLWLRWLPASVAQIRVGGSASNPAVPRRFRCRQARRRAAR